MLKIDWSICFCLFDFHDIQVLQRIIPCIPYNFGLLLVLFGIDLNWCLSKCMNIFKFHSPRKVLARNQCLYHMAKNTHTSSQIVLVIMNRTNILFLFYPNIIIFSEYAFLVVLNKGYFRCNNYSDYIHIVAFSI